MEAQASNFLLGRQSPGYALRRLSLEQPFHPGDIIALAVIEVNEKDDVD